LVIDDEADVREVLKMRFEAGGYDVVTAEDGKGGLEKLKSGPTDLVVLDVMMPEMDGYEVFKALKKDPANSDIPVLMLTGRGAMKDTFEALDADGFIPKPFDSSELMSKVSFLIAKKALVLSANTQTVEVLTRELKRCGYDTYTASNEEEMVTKAREARYKVVIAHIPYITKEPEDFLKVRRFFKERNPLLVIYSDQNAKGTEESDAHATLVIDESRIKWKGAGIETFFDPRASGKSLSEIMKNWLS